MKINNNDVRITVRLPEHLKQQFDEKAAANGQTMTDRIRAFIERDVKR